MSQSNYYDSIASIYDQTRWMTDGVAEEIADFIVELVRATADTSFLEPGVGTGLNVMPLVRRGYAVTGMDISQEMLEQFRQKLRDGSEQVGPEQVGFDQAEPKNLTLIQGDASELPFADDQFDVVLTVHMIHAVADWQHFLDEIGRVLKPGGVYINAQWRLPPARKAFQDQFDEVLSGYISRDRGAYRPFPADKLIGATAIQDYLHSKGYCSDYRLVKEWTVSNTVRAMLGFYRSRAYGFCWRVADEVFEQIMDDFEEVCEDHYGSLDAELSSTATFELWDFRL